MSRQWPAVPLSEILIKAGEWIDIKPAEQYREVTVRLWGKGVVQRREVMGAEISATRRQIVRSQQFILSRIDARNGAFGLIPDFLDGAIVSNDFPVFNLNRSRIVPEFLNWMSKTEQFINLCKKASEGTTNRVRLKEERFLETGIPLPSVSEQRRIVARFEELAVKIEEARGLRRQIASETRTLWESGAAEAFDTTAKCYPIRPLNTLVTIRGGGTPPKWNPSYWEGSIPWITPKDMKTRELWNSIDKISERATQESAAKLIESGTVLVVVRGMILAHTFPSAVLRVKAAINQDMKALIPKEDLTPDYLSTIMLAYNPRILKMVEKSTHDTRKLNIEKLLNIKIPVPPIPEQHRIVANLNLLHTQVDTLTYHQTETAYELDALLPAILGKTFGGEI